MLTDVNAAFRENSHITAEKIIKAVRPLPKTALNFRKFSNTQGTAMTKFLEQQREKRELEICNAVDRALLMIKADLREFFAQCEKNAKSYAENLLTNRSCRTDGNKQELIPLAELQALQHNIKHKIQQDLEKVFGIAAVQVAAIHFEYDKNLIYRLEANINEYYRTLSVMKTMKKAADAVLDKCLGQLNLPWVTGKIIERADFAAMIFAAAGCRVNDYQELSRTEVLRRVKGVLRSIELRLEHETCREVARIYYEISDAIIDKTFILPAPLKRRAGRTKQKTPLLRLVKQAV